MKQYPDFIGKDPGTWSRGLRCARPRHHRWGWDVSSGLLSPQTQSPDQYTPLPAFSLPRDPQLQSSLDPGTQAQLTSSFSELTWK